MKFDDDTFVRLDSVMAEIKKIPEDKSFYMGNMNYYHRPLREGKDIGELGPLRNEEDLPSIIIMKLRWLKTPKTRKI